jgi:uncharacterized protein (DUF1810 family)
MNYDQRSSDEFAAWVLDAHANGFEHGRPFSVALRELRRGKKEEHWIWYVFPQVKGLGSTCISQRFSVRQCIDMSSMLANDTLLENFTAAFSITAAKLADSPTLKLHDVFSTDAKKVASSVALFAGFLNKHPREDAKALHTAALDISAIATRDGFTCLKTAAFLAGC